MHKATTTEPPQRTETDLSANQAYPARNEPASQTNNRRRRAYILEWLDYSSKYGLGYRLSNECLGVLFNDGTRMVYHPEGDFFQYIDKWSPEGERVQLYRPALHPVELREKVMLLQRFRGYFDGQKARDGVAHPGARELDWRDVMEHLGNGRVLTHVEQWASSEHARMFRLSNKVVQVVFTDKTAMVFRCDSDRVVYVDRKRRKWEMTVGEAMRAESPEVVRRFDYSKALILHAFNSNELDA